MEGLLLEEHLQVEYLKLRFTLVISEDTTLPSQKASALRGGMGEMLLRVNCIRDRDCGQCPYEDECVVRRIMYSKMRIEPEFMSAGNSVGYVIGCGDYREHFSAGDELYFDLTLFGRMAVYFGQILQAFQMLGFFGLGKHKAKFTVGKVCMGKTVIMDGQNVYMERVRPKKIADHVRYRKEAFQDHGGNVTLIFHTPITIKHEGKELREFHSRAFLKACERRLYMINCYEGIGCGRVDELTVPELLKQNVRPFAVQRYSSTHDEKIRLDGIIGEARLEQVGERELELFLAGEIMHVGKNSSFGFGRYSVRHDG